MHNLHTTTGAALPLLGWASTNPLDPECVLPLRAVECYPGKPAGGLWTSPLLKTHTATAWMRWCATERHERTFTTLAVIRVAPTARVLVIDSACDVGALDRAYGRGDPQIPPRTAAWPRQSDWEELTTQRVFDWAAIGADFDAVHVTTYGLNCGGGVIPRLRWDVPTVWLPRATFQIEATIPIPPAVIRRPAWARPGGRVRYLDRPRVVSPRLPS
jgi:hypothetical protein